MATIAQASTYTRSFSMGQTGLTVTVQLSKAGAAFAAAAGVVSEVSNGWYKIALTAGDTGTLGDLAYHITATGADDLDMCDQVVMAEVGQLVAAYDAAKTAAQAGDAMALTGAERGSVADKVLGRTISGGADGGRTVRDALRPSRNRVTRDPITGTVTVYQEDDSTPAWTAVMTTDGTALPITEVNPT